MTLIFISYRRSDSADVSGRIYDRLVTHFNRSNVFKDVDSIPLGVDFRQYVDNQIQRCDVALVIIGQQWLGVVDEVGKRRLDDSDDNVRIEIEQAMKRGVPIIPVLVQGATMPRSSLLPSSIASLAYRNAISLHPDPDFHRDIDRLIHNIEAYNHSTSSESFRPIVSSSVNPTPNQQSYAPYVSSASSLNSLQSQRESKPKDIRNPILYIAITVPIQVGLTAMVG